MISPLKRGVCPLFQESQPRRWALAEVLTCLGGAGSQMISQATGCSLRVRVGEFSITIALS